MNGVWLKLSDGEKAPPASDLEDPILLLSVYQNFWNLFGEEFTFCDVYDKDDYAKLKAGCIFLPPS
jgi:hypothetical protein